MTITKRKDSKYFIVDFRYKGRRYKASTRTTNRSEAKAFELEFRRRIRDQELLGLPDPVTFAEACQRYERTHPRARTNPKTAYDINRIVSRILRDFPKDITVADIKPWHIAEFRETLISQGLKPNSTNKYLGMLRAILRKCEIEWGLVTKAPAVKLLTVRPTKLRYLSLEEERALLETATPEIANFLTFLLGTGARCGEACRLTWDDVELGSVDSKGWVRFRTTKNGRDHGVPLTNRVRDMLRQMYAERPQGMDQVFYYRPALDCVHVSGKVLRRRGHPTPIRYPQHHFKRLRDKVGIKDITLHTMRHTYASRLVMAGVPIYEVSKLLNHSNISMTARYAHLSPQHLEKAVARLEATPCK